MGKSQNGGGVEFFYQINFKLIINGGCGNSMEKLETSTEKNSKGEKFKYAVNTNEACVR